MGQFLPWAPYNMMILGGIGRIRTVSATTFGLAQTLGTISGNCGILVIPLDFLMPNRDNRGADSHISVDSKARKMDRVSKIRQAEQNREAQSWQGSPLWTTTEIF
jgi:hypothetical protein